MGIELINGVSQVDPKMESLPNLSSAYICGVASNGNIYIYDYSVSPNRVMEYNNKGTLLRTLSDSTYHVKGGSKDGYAIANGGTTTICIKDLNGNLLANIPLGGLSLGSYRVCVRMVNGVIQIFGYDGGTTNLKVLDSAGTVLKTIATSGSEPFSATNKKRNFIVVFSNQISRIKGDLTLNNILNPTNNFQGFDCQNW